MKYKHDAEEVAFVIAASVLLSVIFPTGMTEARGDVLFDSSCILTTPYDAWYNHCGGEMRWGRAVDIQVAGNFTLTQPCFITAIGGDFLSFSGLAPEGACASVYLVTTRTWEVGEDAFAYISLDADDLQLESFKDTQNGLYGVRVMTDLVEPVFLPKADWYLNLQPSGQDAYAQLSFDGSLDCSKSFGDAVWRDGGERNACCDGGSLIGNEDWSNSGQFEPFTLSMRIEGVAAGDCGIGGTLSAKCKAGRGKVVAKVKGATGAGVLTCWLDATPGPRQDMTITPDGKGKTVFRNVAAGEHTVTVCEQTVSLMCGL